MLKECLEKLDQLLKQAQPAEQVFPASMDDKTLQKYANRQMLTPMTPEQREWCLREASADKNYGFKREHFVSDSDKVLAYHVLNCRAEQADVY